MYGGRDNMKANFVEELKQRGMLHQMMPGVEELLAREVTTAYVGIDPTADSLHIGHLVSVMMLRRLQRAGHRPIAVLGGATGMIGDPSMKSQERNLLDLDTLRHNQEAIGHQLERFIDFDRKSNTGAKLLNNYDWMHDWSFLDFIREIGKHITVNYMMAKDSVQRRLDGSAAGLSFTEFSYQLLQGYDFLHLYRTEGCKLQMGGSDQWGNITTGTELIRRIEQGDAYGLTCPLITKADGGKFGKTEKGNIWIDARYTSPYAFYQFWINTGDEDAYRYMKIFTELELEEIEALYKEHSQAPHLRALQQRLAREITTMVHGAEAVETAEEATRILFGQNTHAALMNLNEATLLEVLEGVPTYAVARSRVEAQPVVVDLLAESGVFASKGEARKLITAGGLSINKEKVTDAQATIGADALISGKYLLVQRGKKNYYLLIAE